VTEENIYKVWCTHLPPLDRRSEKIEKRLAGHDAGRSVP